MSNLNDPFKKLSTFKLTFTDFWENIGVQGTGKMGRLFFFLRVIGMFKLWSDFYEKLL